MSLTTDPMTAVESVEQALAELGARIASNRRDYDEVISTRERYINLYNSIEQEDPHGPHDARACQIIEAINRLGDASNKMYDAAQEHHHVRDLLQTTVFIALRGIDADRYMMSAIPGTR